MKSNVFTTLFFILLFVQTSTISAQGLPGGGGAGGPERIEEGVKFVPVPYIGYNRSIGGMIGALPMLMFNVSKKDTISPSSVAGALGIYTTNDTWFAMAFSKLYLKEDKYRVMAAGGVGNVNFQYWSGILNTFIPYNTGAEFMMVEVQRKVVKNFYAGVNYSYTKFDNTFEYTIPIDSIGKVRYDTSNVLHGAGIVLSHDKRDDVYYPRKGYITNLNYSTYPSFFGNELSQQKLEFDYNRYWQHGDTKNVIAARFYTGIGIGSVTFNQQFIIGQQSDIRGYSQGAFRGDQMLALQGEYRWNLKEKFGLVGFAGVATVFGGNEDSNSGQLAPGLGAGFRYLIFPDNHMNVGMDIAAGINDWSLSFQIGEAF